MRVKVMGRGLRKVQFVMPFVNGMKVLDIGVVQHSPSAYKAENWLHRHIRAASACCVGVDRLGSEVAALQGLGFDVRVGDAQSLDLGEVFDVVVAGDILEHLEDPHGFFCGVKRHLKPGGRLIVTTPNPWFVLRFVTALVRGRVYENPEHTAWYSQGTLRELLRREGFLLRVLEYGSEEPFLYGMILLPPILRHTSIWVVAEWAGGVV